ncbi:unnamed protein product [Ranitomeya imitator]|uniref:Deleted in lung and esophageal cancer protein 1 n=1 Tax=Ranitomeya imitator TaxID=111125 RepID=A0ABN9KU05_9NEOB|nr:unnamed protein product [Ranitomeya imitator]
MSPLCFPAGTHSQCREAQRRRTDSGSRHTYSTVQSFRHASMDRVPLWTRYIDDIFLVWQGSSHELNMFMMDLNSNDLNIRLTHTSNSDFVEFLDVIVKRGPNGEINSDVYRKPTSTNLLLHASSSHPRHMIQSVPVGQFLRLRRICSSDTDFERQAEDLKKRFLERGYSRRVLKRAYNRARHSHRNDLLYKPTNVSRQPDNQSRFITNFNCHSTSIRSRGVYVFPDARGHMTRVPAGVAVAVATHASLPVRGGVISVVIHTVPCKVLGRYGKNAANDDIISLHVSSGQSLFDSPDVMSPLPPVIGRYEISGPWYKDKMTTDEVLPRINLSPDPAMYRPKPSSEKTQDISHLLTSLFKNEYTGEVIGKDTGANLIRSKGGDNPYHQKFVEELKQIRTEYDSRMAECDKVERHIIQARARATAEEERMLDCLKNEAGDSFQILGLPPVESYFRWCVDNDLLKKHKLICPDDYITDTQAITRAPRGLSEPSLYKETFSFHQHVSRSPVDNGYSDPSPPKTSPKGLVEASISSLTLSSSLSSSENISQRKPSTSQNGAAGLERREKSDTNEPIPVFLANPPVVFFPEYNVGQIYEMTVELRNMTASSRHVRVIPPSTPYFSVGLGKFPGEGGIVAPGMSCHYTVRFVPDSLADFEDFILVETQAPYPVLVPIEARRPPPILTVPRTLDCGPCLVGGVKLIEWLCRNEGLSRGKFCIMPKTVWPPANFRTVANAGFVEQVPFCIRPVMFELYPGQEIIIEVVFFPLSSETHSQVFTIVCDNCQVKDITLTGYGQLVGLQLVPVSEDKGTPAEISNPSAEHLVQFPSTNLHSTEQKSISVRNTTHVELPFYWQIVKPRVDASQAEEQSDMTNMEYKIDECTAFTVTPLQGVLQPHKDNIFTVTYTPMEPIINITINRVIIEVNKHLLLIICSTEQHPSSVTELDPAMQDLIVIDLDIKGTAVPFYILLEPYAVIFSGESFTGTAMRKQFKMLNNSKSTIHFEWENISAPNIIQIEPHSGNIECGKFGEFELMFTGLKIGFTSEMVNCHILHSSEPVVLPVEATFKAARPRPISNGHSDDDVIKDVEIPCLIGRGRQASTISNGHSDDDVIKDVDISRF